MNKLYKDLKPIFFIDIETISALSDYDLLEDAFKYQWDRKASFLSHADNTSVAALYFEKAAIYAEFGKIICIGMGYFFNDSSGQLRFRSKAIAHDNETVLLNELAQILARLDKSTLLCAHNGKEFDFPYLCRRFLINGMLIPDILQQAGKKPWDIKHIDTMELWKFGDWKHFTSLDLLATVFNLPSSKTTMTGADVNKAYHHEHNLAKIKTYCVEDVILTARVYLKLKGISWMLTDECIDKE